MVSVFVIMGEEAQERHFRSELHQRLMETMPATWIHLFALNAMDLPIRPRIFIIYAVG
ncbi:hypothetical protein AAZX31_20G132300 [Glycine max]|uniref:Uncharacterized protein n=2 Tax=Glycine subgen. Soja TaxID=1462606 RepID=A0A0R0EBT4_SOYBN|nr:hypothetical protein JHK86_056241 [Glycine max]KAG4910383.1 hypothetical protein JHK87_056499 [Glycine soja]KAG4918967.1 hypothetical protein JHK85_057248 [Glycine max]KAG5075051.1 hypothetical protein JHK84_056282 [Glycine max]KAG5077712.1 hypothetical protein JHK82_056407 [Glycine max]